MNVICCGYRDWAIDAFTNYVSSIKKNNINILLATSPDELTSLLSNYSHLNSVVFLAGWSWIIPRDICERYYIVGVHPSDLPAYAGGSPIQHQILDGITDTMASLFRITPKLDQGSILCKVELSLDGHMTDVFRNLSIATEELLEVFISDLRDGTIIEIKQDASFRKQTLKRLKPEDSKLKRSDLYCKSTRELYNFIRCKEDPYPNAFLEDAAGRLIFKLVEFIPNVAVSSKKK